MNVMDLGKASTGMPAQYYFRKWAKNGIFDALLSELVVKERVRQEKMHKQQQVLLIVKAFKKSLLSN